LFCAKEIVRYATTLHDECHTNNVLRIKKIHSTGIDTCEYTIHIFLNFIIHVVHLNEIQFSFL